MSVCAEIVVLFSEPRCECLLVSMPDFEPVDGPDLEWWVSPSGELEYKPSARNAPLLGESSLEGRLWIGSPGRWWIPEDADNGGNPGRYAEIIRSLMNIPGVQYVWYGRIKDDLGCKDLPAVTEEWLSAFFSVATQ